MCTVTLTGCPVWGVGFQFNLIRVCMSNLGPVDPFAVEYLGLWLHRLVVNLLLGSWAFVVYLGLWHDFVFFEPACAATEKEGHAHPLMRK